MGVAALAQLGVFYWDSSYYLQVYGNLDVDLGWIMLAGSIVFLSLSKIMEQLNEISEKLGGKSAIKYKKDLGNWPPSV